MRNQAKAVRREKLSEKIKALEKKLSTRFANADYQLQELVDVCKTKRIK
jgi:hypothetical protein